MSKQKVIYEIPNFPIKKHEGGLYGILFHETLNKQKKAIFKVGMADSYENRFENYHSYYPLGMYYSSLLVSPTKHKNEVKLDKTQSDTAKSKQKQYYKYVEEYIFRKLVENGAERLRSTTRMPSANKYGGLTDFFYCNKKTLDGAFKKAHERFDGRLLNANLNHIEKQAAKNKRGSQYTAQIHYTTHHHDT